MYIIVGLGNPGAKYETTRHNMGFITIDYLSRELNIPVNRLGFKSLYGQGVIGGEKVILVKPQTFMNLSGQTVKEIVDFFKVPAENLIVIYDDINIPLGKLRIRPFGSDGGHNGMKNIIYLLQSDKFPRIRVGVGMPDNE
ncbi:MAG: aminoacyl-tRNA hydrolase, partial [Monoglobales bacterium]